MAMSVLYKNPFRLPTKDLAKLSLDELLTHVSLLRKDQTEDGITRYKAAQNMFEQIADERIAKGDELGTNPEASKYRELRAWQVNQGIRDESGKLVVSPQEAKERSAAWDDTPIGKLFKDITTVAKVQDSLTTLEELYTTNRLGGADPDSSYDRIKANLKAHLEQLKKYEAAKSRPEGEYKTFVVMEEDSDGTGNFYPNGYVYQSVVDGSFSSTPSVDGTMLESQVCDPTNTKTFCVEEGLGERFLEKNGVELRRLLVSKSAVNNSVQLGGEMLDILDEAEKDGVQLNTRMAGVALGLFNVENEISTLANLFSKDRKGKKVDLGSPEEGRAYLEGLNNERLEKIDQITEVGGKLVTAEMRRAARLQARF